MGSDARRVTFVFVQSICALFVMPAFFESTKPWQPRNCVGYRTPARRQRHLHSRRRVPERQGLSLYSDPQLVAPDSKGKSMPWFIPYGGNSRYLLLASSDA